VKIAIKKIYIPNCPFVDKKYEINRGIIFAMQLLEIDLNRIEKFCTFMDFSIFHSFYAKLVHTISVATEAVFQKVWRKQHKRRRQSLLKISKQMVYLYQAM